MCASSFFFFVWQVPSGQDCSNNVIRRANHHELGLYDLPSFYSPDFVRTEIAMEAGTETVADLARSGRITPFRSVPDGPAADKSQHPSLRELDGRATASGRGLYRNKCFSFLALVAGLAAFGCSLAALAGTTNWVDTWEPIDLPPSAEWPTLFGTGYGSLMPSRSNGKDKSSGSKSSSGSSTTGNKVGNLGFGPDGKSHSDDRHQPAGPSVDNASLVTTARPSPPTTSRHHQQQQTTAASPFVTRPTVAAAAADDDEFDYEDYEYVRDQQPTLGAVPTVGDNDEIVMLRQEDEQQDEEPRRSLVVVFHVGLFRACPVLKGELQPSSVGKARYQLVFYYYSFVIVSPPLPPPLPFSFPFSYDAHHRRVLSSISLKASDWVPLPLLRWMPIGRRKPVGSE